MTIESLKKFIESLGGETKLRDLRETYGNDEVQEHYSDMGTEDKKQVSGSINRLMHGGLETIDDVRKSSGGELISLWGIGGKKKDFIKNMFGRGKKSE